MIHVLNIFAVAIIGMSLFANAANAADPVLVTVAGKKVIIPAPAGMRSVDVAEYQRLHPTFLVRDRTRVLAVFIPVAAKVADLPKAYAYVQCDDPPMNIPPGGIAKLKEAFGKNAAVSASSSSLPAIKERLARGKSAAAWDAPGAQVRAKGMLLEKLALETPDLFAYTAHGVYEVVLGSEREDMVRPIVVMIGAASGSLLSLYYYGEANTSIKAPEFIGAGVGWGRDFVAANGLPLK